MTVSSWLFLLILLGAALYRRYYPVKHIPCLPVEEVPDGLLLIDLRDYNESNGSIFGQALHIPVAYLKRHARHIPPKPLHIIARDDIEKNVGIRLLRRYGYEVKSYSIAACDCQERRRTSRWNITKKSKTA
ncbi:MULTISPECIES: rhodanese [Geobacillus]|uniref:rhodanese n=1 Tax=Geobacillus TaxID=129337 RepID=UPI0009C176CD|nr:MULTISPECIES: rhodanese [Geobacillus]OQP05456.1 rhodanese [Geobacillus sp. 46C-IIa]QIZ68049.1 rhodanese [Geobacillus subterraneus]QNU29178.1 rhodanese [Geobacillus sp. 46C-IIa]